MLFYINVKLKVLKYHPTLGTFIYIFKIEGNNLKTEHWKNIIFWPLT